MGRARTRRLFRACCRIARDVAVNQSPLFLEYLMGKRSYQCTPWGMPDVHIFGWQKPCYLLQDGYAETYKELMRRPSGRAMGRSRESAVRELHGALRYEPSSVDDTFGSLRGFVDTVKATFACIPIKTRWPIWIGMCVRCIRIIRWCR